MIDSWYHQVGRRSKYLVNKIDGKMIKLKQLLTEGKKESK